MNLKELFEPASKKCAYGTNGKYQTETEIS